MYMLCGDCSCTDSLFLVFVFSVCVCTKISIGGGSGAGDVFGLGILTNFAGDKNVYYRCVRLIVMISHMTQICRMIVKLYRSCEECCISC